jgi:hypothetical protein
MAWLLCLILVGCLALLAGWVEVLSRLEPRRPTIPSAAMAGAEGEPTPAAVVAFPVFSGLGGEPGLLTGIVRTAA